MKKFVTIGVVISLWSMVYGLSFGYYVGLTPQPYLGSKGVETEITDEPALFWWPGWAGVGALRDVTVMNTLQGGYFSRPAGWQYYDGTFGQWVPTYDLPNGFCGEYPAGSNQYYLFSYGVWVGAKMPVGGDTIPVVSKGCYSDLSAMSAPEMEDAPYADISNLGLYFSDQRIPEGSLGEENYLFVQTGASQEAYQMYWPFTDTTINKLRRAQGLPEVNMGDIIAQQETYVCAGDWIPESEATGVWIKPTGNYDLWQMGIRIEQRSYSWNYDYNDAYIYFNYKIRNMNSFPLKDVYISFYMDNDIGSGTTELGQGAYDDLLGYDEELDLGYTYDADGFEPGWKTSAGYMGCVMCETPVINGEPVGMTGFYTWLNGDLEDYDGRDDVKYNAMAYTGWLTHTAPMDVRQLSNCGPIPELLPDSTLSFTVAILVASSAEELKERAKFAKTQFESGYLGFSPPPPPQITLNPGDGKVYIEWDGTLPENYECPFSHQDVFEGYRVYKSLSALPDEWELLADYDKSGSSTIDTVLVDYSVGVSKAEIEFVGFHPTLKDEFLTNATYTISFTAEEEFVVHDITDPIHVKLISYNSNAISDKEGYCMYEPMDTSIVYGVYPGYVSGALMYMDGFYITIRDGEYNPDQPGPPLWPQTGDVFTIKTFAGESVGAQASISHYYIDEGLTNGMTYYYSVTAYSRAIPTFGIGELESGKTGKAYWAIPRKEAVDFEGASCELIKVPSPWDAKVKVVMTNPQAMTGDTYKISFFSGDTLDTMRVDYWRLVNTSTGSTLLDSCTSLNWEPLPIFDGFDVRVEAIRKAEIDTESVIDSAMIGWVKFSKDSSNWKLYGEKPLNEGYDPYYEYELTISDTGSADLAGVNHGLFTLWNTSLNTAVPFWFVVDCGPKDTLSHGDRIRIYKSEADYNEHPNNYAMKLIVTDPSVIDTSIPYIPPNTGDIYKIKVINRTTPELEFEILTTELDEKKDTYTLDNIRVVPNPYYVRAPWDRSKYERKIWFQGLPSNCTIHIFNNTGLLIQTIEHNEPGIRPLTGGEEERRKADRCTGAHAWDLLTSEGRECVSGLYIYQVRTNDGKEKIGKFAIIR